MSELDLHDNVRDDVRIDLLCEDVIALTEHLRLKELECQQLAEDNAKLHKLLSSLQTNVSGDLLLCALGLVVLFALAISLCL